MFSLFVPELQALPASVSMGSLILQGELRTYSSIVAESRTASKIAD
jgi:hypothetical protein